jgi:hypothetical protein
MNRSVLLMVSVVSLFSVFPARCGAYQDAITDKRVAVLIEMMLKADTEQKAFSDLEALGCGAVPARIRRMDDRRSLPDQHLSLRNRSPCAFQDTRHYGAIQVVDALAIILNQLTGQNFWSHNGATDEERTRTIQGWRKFLQSTPAPNLCDSPQAVEYTLDGGPGQIALYQADGYLSFVPPEFVVQSLEELERRVGQLPAGSRLHWQPCKRDPSGKPTLFSDGQYELFEKFCRDRKIELLISRSPCNGKSG